MSSGLALEAFFGVGASSACHRTARDVPLTGLVPFGVRPLASDLQNEGASAQIELAFSVKETAA